jgi:L-ascorbate metabolism protein UlaG (beta-lactamase superfamily)
MSRWLRLLLKIVLALLGVLGIAAAIIWQFKLRHSGDLDDYAAYLIRDTAVPAAGAVKVTYVGTTMMLVDDGTTQIVIDPFVTHIGLVDAGLDRAVSTDEDAVTTALERVGANRVKAIFVSHSHYDHAFDLAAVERHTGALVYGSRSTLNVARGGGIPEVQLRLFDLDAPATIGAFTVRVLASKHSPNPLGGEGATIDEPLRQPTRIRAYKEGGTYDFLITRDDHRMLFKGSANWIPGALDRVRADALFLGVGGLGKEPDAFVDGYFAATIDTVRPMLVIPTHWNDFFSPAEPPLPLGRKFMDRTPVGFDRLLARARRDGVHFGILDVYASVVLFRP